MFDHGEIDEYSRYSEHNKISNGIVEYGGGFQIVHHAVQQGEYLLFSEFFWIEFDRSESIDFHINILAKIQHGIICRSTNFIEGSWIVM